MTQISCMTMQSAQLCWQGVQNKESFQGLSHFTKASVNDWNSLELFS